LRAGAISVADGIGDEGGPDRCALGLLRLLLDEVRPARQHAAPRSQTDARSLLGLHCLAAARACQGLSQSAVAARQRTPRKDRAVFS
jgi:hypothetical protein